MSTVQNQLDELQQTIERELPPGITVTAVAYEGPELVVYTRDPEAFAADRDLVRDLASTLRKRITVRPDPEVLSRPDDVRERVRELIPDEAGVTDLQFHEDTGEVVVEAEAPGLVIGSHGSTLRDIRQEVGWAPEVVRTPPVESSTVANVRRFLTEARQERREILERIGRQIHREEMSDEEWVRVSTLGGCREVGRAAYILSTPETRILVDCGHKPGAEDEPPYLQVPEVSPPNSIDAVVLTHAHLDHAALVPQLYSYGYDGPIYATEPTRDLMGLLTLDYLDDVRETGRTVPYESERVREAITHTIPLEYGEVTDVAPDVKLTLHDAGHALGSAVSHFHVGEGRYNVAFTGDFDYSASRLYEGAHNDFPRVETLVLESTYGGRNDYQTDRDDSERKLTELVRRTHARDGTVLVPTAAVGRAQELMLVLQESMAEGELPTMPVHLDGMIREATAIHATYPEYLRDDVRDQILGGDENPFLAEQFEPVEGDADERRAIADGDPSIVLSPRGMLTGGPSATWLRLLGDDADNTLVFVDYQAPGTLGSRVQNGWEEVQVPDEDGRPVTLSVELDVATVDGFSGHADRRGLVDYVRTTNPRPEKVLCVHGNERAVQDLSSALYHDFDLRTFAPKNLETFRFH